MAIILANPQGSGNWLGEDQERSENDVVQLVRNAYRDGIAYKRRTGLHGRLLAAHRYLTTDRVDKMVFYASDDEEECDDCPELFSVNLDFIRLQHDTAMSIWLDALKSRGSDYSSIEPTPIPETSKKSKEQVQINARNAVIREIIGSIPAGDDDEALLYAIPLLENMLGTSDGLSHIDEIVTRQKTIENAKLSAAANKRALNAKTHVDDKLVESNYDEELEDFVSDVFWYDYGVMFAPFMAKQETTKINEKGKLIETTESVWQMQSIHPLNHFFSESTRYDKKGDYEGDVLYLSKNELRALGKHTHGDEGAVKKVLDEFNSHSSWVEIHDDRDGDDVFSIPVIRIFIDLSSEQAKSIFDNDKISSAKELHTAQLVVVEDQILYKELYPRHIGFSPYRKLSFNLPSKKEMASGRGLYTLCRTAQEQIDNALIGLFDNMKQVNKFILEVNQDKLADEDTEEFEDELETDRPIIYTKGVGAYEHYGGNDRAIRLISMPDNIAQFSRTLFDGITLMERVGFSAFALGQGNFANVRSTGQTAILQANGNKRFARFLSHQEDLVESPIIEYIWIAECMKTGDVSITVDGKVRVTSYSGFLQQQNRADELGFFMQNIGRLLADRAQINQLAPEMASFYDQLLGQFVESHGYDASALNLERSTELGELIGGQDLVNQPLTGLDGRNQVPPDLNEVI